MKGSFRKMPAAGRFDPHSARLVGNPEARGYF
jgi:hypothetical protein